MAIVEFFKLSVFLFLSNVSTFVLVLVCVRVVFETTEVVVSKSTVRAVSGPTELVVFTGVVKPLDSVVVEDFVEVSPVGLSFSVLENSVASNVS